MSDKIIEIFSCSNCGAQFPKWSGRCLECGGWGTLIKEIKSQKDEKRNSDLAVAAQVINLSEINAKDFFRLETRIGEVDRVLGGGIVPGSLVLLSGEPGIGKSTVLAQIADSIGRKFNGNNNVFYISGEESASQIKNRFERLNCDINNLSFINETNLEKILATLIKFKPKLVIIDSIQTIYSHHIPSEAGNISQIRAATVGFLELAKTNDIAIILIGHITKDGQVAGPKSLEHIVDTVIYLESETAHNYRLLRSTKNRFGSVNEIGVFEMTDKGFAEVKNPASIFIEEHDQKVTGSVISVIMEGTRPFLVEVQALVTKTVFGYPQRKTSGYDLNRLQVLSAVLTKRANINLTNQDIILNIVGGLKIAEPALDLAVCSAIASSLLNQFINRKTIILGEVGLGGEIRNIYRLKERLAEAEKSGFTRAIIPNAEISGKKLSIIKIKNLNEIVDLQTKI